MRGCAYMFFSPDEMKRSKFKRSAVCHYEIRKEEVESDDFNRFDKFMTALKSYRTLPRQKVLFSFAGYNDDERELVNIPKVVRYAKKIIAEYPHFWYYAITTNSEFFFLADLIEENNYTIVSNDISRKFHIKQDKERLENQLRKMGTALESFGSQANDEDGAFDSFKKWATFFKLHISQGSFG